MNCQWKEYDGKFQCINCGFISPVSAFRNCPRPSPSPYIDTINSCDFNGSTYIGPGTKLKNLLNYIGIVPVGNCKCNARAKVMDIYGPDWCEKNIDMIVGWLREESSKRKLPFVQWVAKKIVMLAIRQSKKTL